MQPVYLEGFSATAGFLEQSPVQFSRHLTCVIGARGTCKSTLVESIRFALDHDERRAAVLRGAKEADRAHPAYGLVAATLGAGTVRCTVIGEGDGEQNLLSVEREVDAAPRIYQDGVREHAQQDILHRFEIYSQGDLQRIAEGDEERLGLIDKPNALRIGQLRNDRTTEGQALRLIGAELKALRLNASRIQAELRNAPDLEEQLAEARRSRPHLSSELEASREQYLNRKNAVTTLREAATVCSDTATYLDQTKPFAARLAHSSERLKALGRNDLAQIQDLVAEGESFIDRILAIAAELKKLPLSSAAATIEREYDEQNEDYFRLQREQNEINEALKREDHLRRQVEHMEGLRDDLMMLQQRQDDLLRNRQERRRRISSLSDQIYDLRIREVDSINDDHGDLVSLSLQAGSQSEDYVELLSTLLSGSRIREQRDVAAELAKRIRPSDLVDFVENGDAQQLARLLDRDLGQMTRVVAHLADHEGLYDLEAEVTEDRLAITLFDNGTAKPIETLSKGQKATALLPLILRPSPHPLIFDQPEDDLDNSFIFKSLIQSVLELKQRRQIVFVTHNANIPVLGEAEQVVVMNMSSPTSAGAPVVGSVDDRKQEILDLLEGGREAFEERHRRYAALLLPDSTAMN